MANMWDYLRKKVAPVALSLAMLVGCSKDAHNEAQGVQKGTESLDVQKCPESLDILVDQNQKISDVHPTITAYDLPNLLTAGKLVTQLEPNTYQYLNQYLKFGPFSQSNQKSGAVIFDENEADQEGYFLFVDDNDPIFQYELDVENGLESRIDFSGNLIDILEQEVNILGDYYNVVQALRIDQGLEFVFMRGSPHVTQDTTTIENYVLGERKYEVTVLQADATSQQARYSINGEITPLLQPGSMFTLADGTKLGQGRVATDTTDFFFDAHSLLWYDRDVSDGLVSTALPQHDQEVIEDADVRIDGSILPNGNFDLGRIQFTLRADAVLGDLYLAPGESLRNGFDSLDEPLGIPGNKLDIMYVGQAPNGKHIVRVCKK